MSLGFLRRKKKEVKIIEEEKPKIKTPLEELCSDNKKLYEAVSATVLLNPDLVVKEGIDSYREKAETYVKNNDPTKARVAYQMAGEIAIYEGKLELVQAFFKKVIELDPGYTHRNSFEFYANDENARKALEVAQEFYKKSKPTQT